MPTTTFIVKKSERVGGGKDRLGPTPSRDQNER